MSGRGRGTGGRGGGGQQYHRGGGRGGSRGGSGGRGGGPGPGAASGGRRSYAYNVPQSPDFPSTPRAPLSQELELNVSLQASSSSASPKSGHQSSSSASSAVLPVPPPSSSNAIRIPVRPGFGTAGRTCVVRANHFLVKVADRDVHHYDVSITPEVTSKTMCRQIIKQLISSYRLSHLGDRMLAYDGRKSVYVAGALPFNANEFIIKLVNKDGGSREREFKVSIKFAAKVDLYHLQQFLQSRQLDTPQETIQALDVVLREMPSTNYEVVGRSFFHPSLGQTGELGNGVEYWMGYYQSLRPTQMGLSLNIDISARPFYEPILVTQFITKYLNIRELTRPLSDQDRVKVKKSLRGIRVEMSHQGYLNRYKLSGISTEPLNQLFFSSDDSGTKMSVVQYFRQKYNIVLQYTYLPALMAGNEAKPVYLPMEISNIVKGQRYTKRLNDKQVTSLLKATCQRPQVREGRIEKMIECNNYNVDKLVNQEFGITVRSELTPIDARVLPPPVLKYHETGGESRADPRVGQWNMINKKMINGGKVDFWTCVNFSRTDPAAVTSFCQELVAMCCSKGMVFHSKPLLPFQSAHQGQIERTLVNIHSQCNAKLQSMNAGVKLLQLLIIILPDASGYYGTIKRICETELGIVSQCCQPRHVFRSSKQYLENLALKINVKVGGRNTVLLEAIERKLNFLTDRITIVFGADVTHPQPGEDATASIAAVVASMDWPEVTKYRGLVSAQRHRQEMIQDLYTKSEDPKKGIVHGGMIRELLLAFYKSTNLKPQRIIFYRDGVSEGQFNQVLLHEMDAIRQACVSIQENYLPPVTFIVVQKRHHTRLFPAVHGDRNTTDRSGNILPGTVVDTKICHPTEFDFYLCSHAGIQGTSRPAHYHVLFDENRFTADALQLLTNNLCYTYARCTRSVSIVPPAYYAHLAAFRARYYVEGGNSESGSASATPGNASRERSAEVRPLPVIKDNVKDVMFYC